MGRILSCLCISWFNGEGDRQTLRFFRTGVRRAIILYKKNLTNIWTYRRKKLDNIKKKIQEAYEADDDDDFGKKSEKRKGFYHVVYLCLTS